jgi:hypothetical protein
MTIVLCPYCKHYSQTKPRTCAAFPEGIPQAIFSGRVKHILPMDGDGGIVFEAKSEAAARLTDDIVTVALRHHAISE